MFLLGVLGGWLVLSCVAAPFIGHFIAFNATVADASPALAGPLQEAPLKGA